MKIAVDSSVILSIFNGEERGRHWLHTLIQRRKSSKLVVCDLVVAEIRPALDSERQLSAQLAKLGIEFSACNLTTASKAGEIHRMYRQKGGNRLRALPDFLIGAHAQLQADALATDDAGFMRKYFSGLELIPALED